MGSSSSSMMGPDIELQTFSIFYKPQLALGSGSFYGLAGFTRGSITTPDVEGAEEVTEDDFSVGLGWSFELLPFLELQVEYLHLLGEGGSSDDDEAGESGMGTGTRSKSTMG